MNKQTIRKLDPAAAFKPKTYNPETRSVRACIATESEVVVFDTNEMRPVKEVLLMSGCVLPETDKLPLLDSHRRESVRDCVGSVRDLRIEGSELCGTLFFSDSPAGRIVAQNYEQGHLSELSIGGELFEYENLRPGDEFIIQGKTYRGPLRVVTSWRPFETSCVILPADSRATVRSKIAMETENNNNKIENSHHANTPSVDPIKAERQRISEIYRYCRIGALNTMAQRFIEDGTSADEVRERVLMHMERTMTPISDSGGIATDVTEYAARSDARIDGLLVRSGFMPKNPAKGYETFANEGLFDIARETLGRSGVDSKMMNRSAVIKKAISMRTYTTDDFPLLLSNAAGKVLRETYEQAPSTFQLWTNKGTAENFKSMSRLILSEAGDLDQVNEGAEYTYGGFNEDGESFSVLKYGKIAKLTFETLTNDDLGAFVRLSRAWTLAARRKVEELVYNELLTGTMRDTYAICHANHSNIATGDDIGTISIDTLSAARLAMRLQTGGNGAILATAPHFLLTPASLETAADQVVNTSYGYESAEGVGIINPFYKKLTPICCPILDASDADAWYVIADNKLHDTIEIAYLHGQDYPTIEEDWDFTSDAFSLKVRLVAGCKCLEYRSFYKNPGTSE